MANILKKALVSMILLLALFVPIATGRTALAAGAGAGSAKNEICSGIGVASGSCSTKKNTTIENALKGIINLLSLIAGFAGLVMIILSGLRFVTAQGESSSVTAARSALIWALVGLVVALLAQVIVHFVIGKIVG